MQPNILYCSTVLCDIVKCRTVQFSMVTCIALQHNIVLPSTVQCNIVYCSVMNRLGWPPLGKVGETSMDIKHAATIPSKTQNLMGSFGKFKSTF